MKFNFKNGDYIKFNLVVRNLKNELVDDLNLKNQELILGHENESFKFNLNEIVIGHELTSEIIALQEYNEQTWKLNLEILDYKSSFEMNLMQINNKFLQELEIKNKILSDLKTEKNNLEITLKDTLEILKTLRSENQNKALTLPKEELEKAQKYALQKFVDDFSNPFSILKVAVNAGSNSNDQAVKNYVLGFNMVLNQVEDVLRNHGIIEFSPEIGSIFDPETSKVIEQIEDYEKPNNTVLKVTSSGLKLHDRVIKPAIVVVSKGKILENQESNKKKSTFKKKHHFKSKKQSKN
ncbi:nucleotide exchange factor GrpE [Mycoplasmopsis gallinarum]|uniref:Protein GrpE n=1 Tax=Mycoplasmopsis gallinarum TaxID=29557 RepID=A0A168R8E4_9BACT|nr:nucleotide exchange factor GrpE [Mycoplasmopsis gallinarum]OAB48709.1 Heat shock protein GrpE [Mycoplasmopsis gallinarum]